MDLLLGECSHGAVSPPPAPYIIYSRVAFLQNSTQGICKTGISGLDKHQAWQARKTINDDFLMLKKKSALCACNQGPPGRHLSTAGWTFSSSSAPNPTFLNPASHVFTPRPYPQNLPAQMLVTHYYQFALLGLDKALQATFMERWNTLNTKQTHSLVLKIQNIAKGTPDPGIDCFDQ